MRTTDRQVYICVASSKYGVMGRCVCVFGFFSFLCVRVCVLWHLYYVPRLLNHILHSHKQDNNTQSEWFLKGLWTNMHFTSSA